MRDLWRGELIDGRTGVLVTSQGLFEILPDGSVIRVVVHVPQGPYATRGIPEMVMLEDPVQGWHKYHVFWCRTLQQWQHRLRKTLRDDGKFTYPVFWKNGVEFKPELRDGGRPLVLCRNCAGMLASRGVEAEPEGFDLASFLHAREHGTEFGGLSFVSDFDVIPNVYAEDWNEISRRFKAMRDWTCERCFVDLSQDRQFLHAHHLDHHKGNNSVFNLQALCIECHAREHPHNRGLTQSSALRQFQAAYRSRRLRA